jgi:2-oxo-4-hydroxy-4-carboxy-5-ureidoimidazoline decarboxylase
VTTFALERRAFLGGLVATMGLAAAAETNAQVPLQLADVNRMDQAAFVKAFGGVYELSPWVADAAYKKRPFKTVTALHLALADVFAGAPRDQRRAFLKRLSDIGDKSARPGTVTAASRAKQKSSGVDSLDPADQALLEALNKAYRQKFDMAFTICERRNSPAAIFSEYMRCMSNSLDTEIARATEEEILVARLRVAEMVSGEDMPKVYGDLTAHVLDATIGKPASGVAVELREMWGVRWRKVADAVTNVDGRASLLEEQPVPIGRYELWFGVGDYFRQRAVGAVAQQQFLDRVPLRTFVSKPEESYHFPLITTPFGYTIHG